MKTLIFQQLTNGELRQAINELSLSYWEDDAVLRKLAIDVYGEDNTMTMLGLAPFLAKELLKRTNF